MNVPFQNQGVLVWFFLFVFFFLNKKHPKKDSSTEGNHIKTVQAEKNSPGPRSPSANLAFHGRWRSGGRDARCSLSKPAKTPGSSIHASPAAAPAGFPFPALPETRLLDFLFSSPHLEKHRFASASNLAVRVWQAFQPSGREEVPLVGNLSAALFFFNSRDKWVFTYRTKGSIISQIFCFL